MIPLISLATHFKPGCNPSLIDNILTNSSESIKMTGVFESGVSHHHPIFCFFDLETPQNDDFKFKMPKYDYSEANMTEFCNELENLPHKDINRAQF